jgi:hypothetical protein
MWLFIDWLRQFIFLIILAGGATLKHIIGAHYCFTDAYRSNDARERRQSHACPFEDLGYPKE